MVSKKKSTKKINPAAKAIDEKVKKLEKRQDKKIKEKNLNPEDPETKAQNKVSNDEVNQLKEELETVKNSLLYEKAELDNLRKRHVKEKSDLRRYVQKEILHEFLPVVDNLERAVEHMDSASKETLVEGVKMTLSIFKEVFSTFHVKPFDSVGKAFDPEKQEAMSREARNDIDPDTVTQEFIKGYMFEDSLLRPAQVVVSYKGEEKENTSQNEDTQENEQDTTDSSS